MALVEKCSKQMAVKIPLHITDLSYRLVGFALWVSVMGIPTSAWFLPLATMDRVILLVVSSLAVAMIVVLLHIMVERYGFANWIAYLLIAGSIIYISGGSYLFGKYDVSMDLMYVALIASAGLVKGETIARHTAWASNVGMIAQTILSHLGAPGFASLLVMKVLLLFLASFVVINLIALVKQKSREAQQQNRELALLLETARLGATRKELYPMLADVAQLIARQLPATVCRVGLIDETGDCLEICASYSLMEVDGFAGQMGNLIPLAQLPVINRVLHDSKMRVVKVSEVQPNNGLEDVERLFFTELSSLFLVPLKVEEGVIGVIMLGEARSWERQPVIPKNNNLLEALAAYVASSANSRRLFLAAAKQAEKLAVLNRVASAIGSTLDMDQLLELIYQQLTGVLPADTYFVSLVNLPANQLELRILIDKGKRYPEQNMPLGQGLAGWVVGERKPLLIRQLSLEYEKLPMKPLQLGDEEMSESWAGVPIMSGDRVLGLLAVANYQPYAFDEEDIKLLSSLAAHAALALANASHHEEVEEQARRDSMTGAYNHGYLLQRLRAEIETARQDCRQVSLIMLDVDYFKEWNDEYGHQIGDEVLRMLVRAIMAHIKKSDIVGRWGGEEFAVVLPGAGADQAALVAERIRTTLAESELRTGDGQKITSPTVSQGIATFPDPVQEGDRLVDIADKALYLAKSEGRDQIRVASLELY